MRFPPVEPPGQPQLQPAATASVPTDTRQARPHVGVLQARPRHRIAPSVVWSLPTHTCGKVQADDGGPRTHGSLPSSPPASDGQRQAPSSRPSHAKAEARMRRNARHLSSYSWQVSAQLWRHPRPGPPKRPALLIPSRTLQERGSAPVQAAPACVAMGADYAAPYPFKATRRRRGFPKAPTIQSVLYPSGATWSCADADPLLDAHTHPLLPQSRCSWASCLL